MPVALLNELVLMGLGLYLGYKGGQRKAEIVQFLKEKDIYTVKDFYKIFNKRQGV